MQPLTYQIGRSTCWAISIVNGIMFLRGRERRDGERDEARIESFQYKVLHSTLNTLLWIEGVWYNDNDNFRAYQNVLETLSNSFSLRFSFVNGKKVTNVVRNLDFRRKVGICDVGNGAHCILLNGRSECGEWVSAFDPWWYHSTENDRSDNENVQFPDEDGVNVRIRLHHLLEHSYNRYQKEYKTGKAYPMGRNIEKRFLTVIDSNPE